MEIAFYFGVGIVFFLLIVAAHWRIDSLRDRVSKCEDRPQAFPLAKERIKFLVTDRKSAFIIEQDRLVGDYGAVEEMRKRICECFPNASVLRVPESAHLTPLHPEIKAFFAANQPQPAKKR